MHLIPAARRDPIPPAAVERAGEVLVRHGLAVLSPDGQLVPGPRFAAALQPRALPVAGRPRGEVRIESGDWRCYPDPGPEGFESDPPQRYLARCPHCGVEIDLFRLRFPALDPMAAECPGCRAELSLLELGFEPDLPAARLEITFGDLDGRPSLTSNPVIPALEEALGLKLREVHVTL